MPDVNLVLYDYKTRNGCFELRHDEAERLRNLVCKFIEDKSRKNESDE